MDFLEKLDSVIDDISNLLGDDDVKTNVAAKSTSNKPDIKKKNDYWRPAEVEASHLAEKSTRFLTHFKPVHSGIPRCVLVVDGGGLKGYMSIQILKTLEEQLKLLNKNFQLNQAFDLIMGTSTGGLISLGLGKMGMTCDEIADMYDEVGSKVFATHSSSNYIPDTVEDWFVGAWRGVKTATSLVGNVGGLDTDELVKILKKRIETYTGSEDTPMYEPNKPQQTKCGVITTLCNNNDFQNAMILRSYNINREIEIFKQLSKHKNEEYKTSDKNDISKIETKYDNIGYSECIPYFDLVLPGIHECLTWEAARATSAAPTYFEDMFINMPKALAIDVIKRNICHATKMGKNPQTGFFDFTKMFMPSKNDLELLHKCAVNTYLLKYENNNNKDISKNDIINDINIIVQNCINYVERPEYKNSSYYDFTFKKLDKSKYNEKIYDIKYNLRFQDGGLSANSPIMTAFVDATRLWPNSDILILSIGTGVSEIKDYYKHGSGEPHFGRVFASMFGAKDITGLLEMVSLAKNKGNGVHLQRMNPEVASKSSSGGDLLDMADYSNMKDWKEIGQQFGQNHKRELSDWAKFLYDNYQRKNGQMPPQ